MQNLRARLSVWLTLRPQPPVPWTGFDVLAALAFALLVCPVLGVWVLEATHFFQRVYGSDLIEIYRTREAGADGALARARLGLWLNSLILPLQVVGLLLFMEFLRRRSADALQSPPLLPGENTTFSPSPPEDTAYYPLPWGVKEKDWTPSPGVEVGGSSPRLLRLTWRRIWLNLGVGALAALLLTPLVLGLNYLVSTAFQKWTPVEIEQHPLLMLGEQVQALEMVVLVFAAVIAAPLLEEVLVRGLLQPWFASRSWGGHLAMAAALLLALQKRADGLSEALRDRDPFALLLQLLPALFVLVMVPGYLLVWWRSRTPAGPGLYGTALLFAAAHSAVWPTPVPLFVLGLGLGYLYQQTQSLIAPVVLHALFNAVSCVLLLWR